MQNQGRIKCLKAREDYLRSVLDEAQSNLSKISSESSRYPAILKGLILQVLFDFFNTFIHFRDYFNYWKKMF